MTGGGSTTGERAKERRKKYRLIYDTFCDNPRIIPSSLANILQETPKKTEKLIEKAISEGILYYPQLRRRSYQNTKQYVHFLKSPNSFELFIQFMNDNRISYHAKITGYLNAWVTSDQKLDLPDSIIEGYRTDFHFTKAPRHSLETALQEIHQRIDVFDPKEYTPANYCQSHLHEKVYFPPEYEIMFRYFKTNLRRPLTPLMADHKIPIETIEQFLSDVFKLFTVTVSYYPESLKNYEPWLFKVDTRYEDFIIGLFSELPTASLFFKVNNHLFMYVYGKRELIRSVKLKEDINKIQIPWIMHKLRKKGIITHEEHGLVDCYWIKSR